ncbi:MAG: 50S ribosomal protein L6 [Candidatus Woesearchaeota archaeon]
MKDKKKSAKEAMQHEIQIEPGITVALEGRMIVVKGPKGEVRRDIGHKKMSMEIAGDKITIKAAKSGKKEKKLLGSLRAHVKNMMLGCKEPHTYKLKICSSHFPMNVTVAGNEVIIKNLVGAKVAKKLAFSKDVTVKVEGSEITVQGVDKEQAGSTAAGLEKITKRANYDRRVFQDGIYITSKP